MFLHQTLLLFAVKSSRCHISHPAAKNISKRSRGKLAPSSIPQHGLTSVSRSVCSPSVPFSLATPLFIPPSSTHPPISNPHLCASWTRLISALANIHSPPLSSSPPSSPFTPHLLSFSPLRALLLSPLLCNFLCSNEMLCTEESVHIPYRQLLSGY